MVILQILYLVEKVHQAIQRKRSNCAAIFLCLFLPILFGCGSTQQPQRIISIPETAIWIGGSDGGVWFDVGNKKDSSWPIRIFNDYTGQLIDSGTFVVCHYCRNEDLFNVINEINFYDGERIHLTRKVGGRNCHLDKVGKTKD